MSCVCLWIPDRSTVAAHAADLEAALLELAPRVAVDARGVVWLDGRGLGRRYGSVGAGEGGAAGVGGVAVLAGEASFAEAVLERVAVMGIEAYAGSAAVPIAAELAARGVAEAVETVRREAAAQAVRLARAAESRPLYAVPKAYSARAGGGAASRTGADASRSATPSRTGRDRIALVTADSASPGSGPAAAPARERIRCIAPGEERQAIAATPIAWLSPPAALADLLEGVGIRCCGELAPLAQEEVEVRFGAEGVALWRLTRADDPRRLFTPVPPERPHASLDFIDYVVTDPERLVFTANALLGSVCDALHERGEHARRLTLGLTLGNGSAWSRTLKPARPTASRERWLRLLRAVFERLTVPDAVAGMSMQVDAVEAASAVQGDLFDRGFATAEAVEAALARLLDEQGEDVVVEPEVSADPRVERRARWRAVEPAAFAWGAAAAGASAGASSASSRGGSGSPPESNSAPIAGRVHGAIGHPAAPAAALTLQLLPEPRRVRVDAVPRRDHAVPVRFHDGGVWRGLLTSAGPDRISGGRWEEEPYAREYFRCVTEEGVLVWVFRDARREEWYLHGWWD